MKLRFSRSPSTTLRASITAFRPALALQTASPRPNRNVTRNSSCTRISTSPRTRGEVKKQRPLRHRADHLGDLFDDLADLVFGDDQRRRRSAEHTSELQSRSDLGCRPLLETQ